MEQPPPTHRDRDPAGAAGTGGADDPLAFEPVPRKQDRVDGWNAERQRAFIAALAVTGSPRRAAIAIGSSSPTGAVLLRDADGAESFRAAWDRAMAMAREKGARRLSAGVGAVRDEDGAWAPAPWSRAASRRPAACPERVEGEPDQEDSEEARLEWLVGIVRKYLIKVKQERDARLAGEIVAADFYVRQITHIEVTLDLMGGGFGALMAFREQGHHLIDIAETPMSRILGEARRAKWAELGEPPRPEHPPRRYLVEQDGFATEPLEFTHGGLEQSHQEQRRAFEEQHARDAAAQIEWEALARRDYEDRRDSDPSS